MNKLLREPLLHFLLLGFALFVVHGWIGGPAGGDGERIIVTRGRIEQLAAGFERMHQRAPQADELDELIDDSVREEILYREAKALGLDRDDTIIRRRLRQKLEFVSEDLAAVAEPTDVQLQAYLDAHADKFRPEARYSFKQVFLDPRRRGEHLAADVQATLAQLQAPGAATDGAGMGDALLVQRSFERVSASELAGLFGARFEPALRNLAVGRWQGPVASGYGMHLVFVDARVDSGAAALADVRVEVRRDWIHDQHQQSNERFYADLRARYEVEVERVDGVAASALVAGTR